MQELIPWVWSAFAIAWIFHALYALSLAMRQKKLMQQIEDLQQVLKQQQK